MNRDDWNQVLETEPMTANQRGAIMREFDRLGFDRRRDRAERLAACASLLGIDELGSTADLTQGQAGQLVNALQRITSRAELLRAAALPGTGDRQPDEHQHQADAPGDNSAPPMAPMTWPQVLGRLMAIIYVTVRGNAGSSGSGDEESSG